MGNDLILQASAIDMTLYWA